MKKIIDSKKYDTDTADHIHTWDNGRFGNDFRYRLKSLYRTKNGAWFLLHEGGPMTENQKCPFCNGSGVVFNEEKQDDVICPNCDGTGLSKEYRRIHGY